ncbi:hypothetical protein M427DRAFT_153314 [Gonapodya prolifera JEL478]|uniref:Uncharacterized protein n=1 Tax=Gonapodya prolifera (strain JEL478) TaxID=1344416 RepID=A0A139AMX3_GONPJ|nr:hypothetical protein M427DRAFT_153314 [Gonapodya prolifera JEL478]|eukprot:KXS18117.1 hypothetical protein M427DRAFT_153314 [Gonapodya prolifera JEL478]
MALRCVLAALLLSALSALSLAQGTGTGSSPIAFNTTADGNAVTSLSTATGGITTLTAGTTGSGARIYYTKLTNDSSATIGLANVLLTNAEFGTVSTLMSGFDTIKQECSCYWIDANDLVTQFPTLQSSYQYTLTFTNPEGKYNITSGVFGLQLSAGAAASGGAAGATSSRAPSTTAAMATSATGAATPTAAGPAGAAQPTATVVNSPTASKPGAAASERSSSSVIATLAVAMFVAFTAGQMFAARSTPPAIPRPSALARTLSLLY